MAKLGAYGTFPLRLGGAVPAAKTMHDALNASRGTALDTTPTSPVWAETLAEARAVDSVWSYNELLGNQFAPTRMSSLLSRWETILEIPFDPSATLAARRATVALLVSRTGAMPNDQTVIDALNVAGSPVTFTIAHNVAGAAGVRTSWPGGWYVQSRGTTPPVVSLTGAPNANYNIQITIFIGGAIGAAMFRWSIDAGKTISAPILAAPSYALPGTGLTVSFAAGTYATDNVYVSSPVTVGFSSAVANIVIVATKPSWMSFAAFTDKTRAVFPLLDSFLPAWISFRVALDGTSPGQFILNDSHNLDFERMA